MNAKCRILYLLKMFIRMTDSEHFMSMTTIMTYLSNGGYGVGKRTIKEDMDALTYMGFDIEYIHNKGYHLKKRLFSLAILKMLADAIASFRFLTVENSEMLFKSLENFCSTYEAPILRREITITNRVKSDNEQIFENIDLINSAFHNNKQILFDYYDYDINKQLVCRDHQKRTCSPCALIMSNEYYYVVSHYAKYADFYTNFRLDRMKNIQLVDSDRELPNEKLDLERYIKSSFSMFSGKDSYVTLRFPLENKYCNVVIDRFGKSVLMMKDRVSKNHFTVDVPIKTDYPQPFFSWIFSFDGNAEILKPSKLKEMYIDSLLKYCTQSYA